VIHWTDIATFFVPGAPKPQPRHRARVVVKPGRKPFAHQYDPGDADGWKRSVVAHGHRHQPSEPIDGPVRVDVELRLPRTKELMRPKYPAGPMPCHVKPDVDNFCKAIYDAMTDAGWFKDDGRIVGGSNWKMYAGKSEQTGAWIKVCVPADEPALFGVESGTGIL